jgi:hypothetical protein
MAPVYAELSGIIMFTDAASYELRLHCEGWCSLYVYGKLPLTILCCCAMPRLAVVLQLHVNCSCTFVTFLGAPLAFKVTVTICVKLKVLNPEICC